MNDRPDIVAALREGVEPYGGVATAEEIMAMAADEIERLRSYIERVEKQSELVEAQMRNLGKQLADAGRENERLRALANWSGVLP